MEYFGMAPPSSSYQFYFACDWGIVAGIAAGWRLGLHELFGIKSGDDKAKAGDC
jgi:hypothetical protein